MNTAIVNMFGGPGAGKSVAASGVYSLLKMHGVKAEIVTEFAKDLVWEGRLDALKNQYYIFGEQHHRMYRLLGSVDVVITDSPILLSIVYGKKNCLNLPSDYYKTVEKAHKSFNNINFFIQRGDNYKCDGRVEDLEKALKIDEEILNTLNKYIYFKVRSTYKGINDITSVVLKRLGLKQIIKLTCI